MQFIVENSILTYLFNLYSKPKVWKNFILKWTFFKFKSIKKLIFYNYNNLISLRIYFFLNTEDNIQ